MNNRTIKFRAWSGNEWIEPDYVDREGLAWWKSDSIPVCSKIVSQYCGFQDSNGNDVYEGDLIEMSISESSQSFVLMVQWLDRSSGWSINKAMFDGILKGVVVGNKYQLNGKFEVGK